MAANQTDMARATPRKHPSRTSTFGPLLEPRPKQCSDFFSAANRGGATTESVMLKDVGMHDATHMMMDKNSIQIGNWLADWIGYALPSQACRKCRMQTYLNRRVECVEVICTRQNAILDL